MMRSTALAALTTVVALAVPSSAAIPAGRDPLQFLHVAAAAGPAGLAQIRDSSGRSVILRGVNVNGLVDYFRADQRPPYPTAVQGYRAGCPRDDAVTTAVPLCQRDLRQIARLGFDVIRLPVSWSLLEPVPGRVDRGALDRIAQVVGWASAAHVQVVVDLHQDNWGKTVFTPAGGVCPPGSSPVDGGDGAPGWASAHLQPACAPGGAAELDPAVQEAAQRFWADLPAADGVGLQEHYAAVLAALAARFAEDPTVAGYDVMNEPQPGVAPGAMDGTELMRFYGRAVNAVVSAVPRFRQLMFVEPAGTRNVTAARTFVAPWSVQSPYPNVVYAPHVYTGVFTADQTALGGRAGQLQSSDRDYAAAVGDAQALGLPLWVGEFGNAPEQDRQLLDPHYRHQDAAGVGGTLWVWKEHGSWGLYRPPYDGGGVAVGDRSVRVATAYPRATAGVLDQFGSDPFTGAATLAAHSPAVAVGALSQATVLVLPATFPGALVAHGAVLQVTWVAGLRQVALYPTGGSYDLTVG